LADQLRERNWPKGRFPYALKELQAQEVVQLTIQFSALAAENAAEHFAVAPEEDCGEARCAR